MPLVKSFWKNLNFSNYEQPKIHCPTCKKGFINPIKDSVKFKETAETVALKKSDGPWSEMDLDFKFSCLLKCDNNNCGEVVSCAGTGFFDQDDPTFDEETGQYWASYFKYFKPEYFSKPIHIIELKDLYPSAITKKLEDSFKIFFCDSESCANKIRIVVEVLMDALKVKKTVITTGNKRKNLTLHARILNYGSKNKELSDLLLAIKWIGNSGSHNSKVTKDDTLDAYRILEYVLDKLYDKNATHLMKMAKIINKKRIPLSQIELSKKKKGDY
ncbi:hypothetical protein Niako_5986 [Niastella koreensis GR20-10]|uniref:DUF4145 domain-containing protein n=1 Tax=Niastella koreensis (strain DSM 17620 / KACC 11465 / NBRC 106392 / GR20-10) TaxID=700598 RepID=G8TRR8_NIAKG|nr:DUF4145 domain-containing protein [Niastella koreensis]AEW02215.1 hypothetical protein Niako_5986 [Niastella koreensis GR20-10]